MNKKNICCILTAALFLTNTLSGCGSTKQDLVKSGFYFNTIISITLYDSSYEDLLEDCFDLADTYEHYFSNTITDSDVSKINDADGDYVEVHDETIELIEKGLSYCELSGGKFDITIGALSSLWDFSNKTLSESSDTSFVPTSDAIAAALATVNYNNIKIDGNKVALTNPDATLDLGGIAKGYIADKMKAYLTQHGVTSGIINLGGNVLVLGPKENGDSYNVGIQKPFDENGSSIAVVKVTDQTVVSSGVYERYFIEDDILYHHILDTSTGYPYEIGLLGITVITDSSTDADGLSTTCFALGLTDGMALIESLPDTEAIFITDDNQLHVSSGIGTTIPYEKL